MSHRPRPRRGLVVVITAVLALGLSGCTTPSADVPDGAVPASEAATPARAVDSTETAAPVDAEQLTRLITDCLARYGLAERPPAPDDSLSTEERMAAEQLVAAYEETLTNCSAEALATATPVPEQDPAPAATPEPATTPAS